MEYKIVDEDTER